MNWTPNRDEVSTEPDSTIPQVSTANALTVAEGIVGVFNLSATDSDTDSDTDSADLTWTLTGGADQSHFILTSSGALVFTQAKEFEAPDDDGADGTYNITVQVSDGVNDTSSDITVTLADIDGAERRASGSRDSDGVRRGPRPR